MHFIIKEILPLRDSSSISSLVLSRANWKVDHLAKFGVDGEALFIGPLKFSLFFISAYLESSICLLFQCYISLHIIINIRIFMKKKS